jgi:hypothetical protein
MSASMTVGLVSIASQPLQGAEAKAETGGVTVGVTTSVEVLTEVVRAPFSEAMIAERLAADPEFFRTLILSVASELKKQADAIDTQNQDNEKHSIKGQLLELADGFDQAASELTTHSGILTAAAVQKAAEIISKVRDAYSAFCSAHPEVVRLAGIFAAGYVLHMIGGVSADISALISYAIIQKEELSKLLPKK